jgi:hypothetical protein
MTPVEGHPGWIRCTLCGFTTQLIGYNAKAVKDDFDALFEEEIAHKESMMKKRGGGGGGGRRPEKPKKYVARWYQVDRQAAEGL